MTHEAVHISSAGSLILQTGLQSQFYSTQISDMEQSVYDWVEKGVWSLLHLLYVFIDQFNLECTEKQCKVVIKAI